MPHQFVERLEELKERLSRMCAMVQQSVEQAVEGLLTLQVKVAEQANAIEEKVDEEEVRIEKSACDILALHAPAASDLRTIITILKVNGELERIADCAVNIAQRVSSISRFAGYEASDDLKLMASTVIANLRETVRALNLEDEQIATQVLRSDDVVDALYHQIVQDMLTNMEHQADHVGVDLSTIMVAKNLERIGDHCINIAEDVVFIQTGRIIRHIHNNA